MVTEFSKGKGRTEGSHLVNTTNRPQVLAVLDKDRLSSDGRYGPCPHCGEGRQIRAYHFLCADGSEQRAVAKCFRQFPLDPISEQISDGVGDTRAAHKPA